MFISMKKFLLGSFRVRMFTVELTHIYIGTNFSSNNSDLKRKRSFLICLLKRRSLLNKVGGESRRLAKLTELCGFLKSEKTISD